MKDMINYAGILGFIMLLVTGYAGSKGVKVQTHKLLAGITVLLIAIHALTKIYFLYFAR